MNKIKVLIFDAYGTLFDVNSAAKKISLDIGDDWEDFANYWRTTQLEYTWLRSLMRRHKNFWSITKESLEKAMNLYNIHSSKKEELLNLYRVLDVFPEVKYTLNYFKKKNFKISILSNGTHDLIKELVDKNELGEYINDIFSIEEVGIYKPDPTVYEIPIKKYNIRKNEVMFFSSNTWDISGAGNFGYNCVWVNRNKNVFDLLDYNPEIIISDLKQVLKRLNFYKN